MTTVGGAISGYCAIGSTCDAISPASVMMIEMTPAKIGRLMKNCENDIVDRLLVRGLGRRRRAGRRFGHRNAGTDLQQVVDDDTIAGAEAGYDRPIAADPIACPYHASLRLAFGVDDEHEIALFGLHDGRLRNEEDVLALAGGDAHVDELTREELLAWIVEFPA